jgi:hypothetical protein
VCGRSNGIDHGGSIRRGCLFFRRALRPCVFKVLVDHPHVALTLTVVIAHKRVETHSGIVRCRESESFCLHCVALKLISFGKILLFLLYKLFIRKVLCCSMTFLCLFNIVFAQCVLVIGLSILRLDREHGTECLSCNTDYTYRGTHRRWLLS